MLIVTYAPLNRINKHNLKFKSEPGKNLGLQKSIYVKNKLLKNFINKKKPTPKEEFQTNYKTIEIYSPTLRRKVNRLIMINILKELEMILKATSATKLLFAMK